MTDRPSPHRLKLEAVYLRCSVNHLNNNLDDVVNGDEKLTARMAQVLADEIANAQDILERMTEWLAQMEIET